MILVTGFGPFGQEDYNPSEHAARRAVELLRDRGLEASFLALPVSFRRAWEALEAALRELRPDAALSVGLRPGASCIYVERVAVNLMDASMPDVDGLQPADEPIDPQGPAAYMATAPVKEIVRRLREAGIPAALSYSAGTYLCNFVFYRLLRHGDVHGYPRRVAFLHVPYAPHQAAAKAGQVPSMDLELMARAVAVAAEAMLE